MYLDIGGEYSVSTRLIIGIFDLDQITRSKDRGSSIMLSKLESDNLIEPVSAELPRSLILAYDRAYLSPISARTLRQRLSQLGLCK